ncbi:MAG TPA: protein kinase [Gemmataceae bacterium]|jgi:WD40 repeat protein/serine/threonine protein kinase|nr:protein kinase [Gemmataceae bacterium]
MTESLPLDEQLVQRLPLPLAQLCRRAHNVRTPLERHQAAYYLWEAALKLLASVAVVEYADLRNHDPELVERLKNLARPSLGHWWEFIRRLVPVLAERGDAGFAAVRELVLGRARDDAPRAAGLDAALIEVLEGRSGARSTVRLTELIDRLVQYRNHEMGHGAAGQRQADFYARMSRALLAGAAEVLGRLDVLAGRRLLCVGEVRRQASGHWLVELSTLTGETAKRIESLEFPEAMTSRLPCPDQVYLEVPAGAGRPETTLGLRALHPLVHFEAASGLVYFLNARRGKRGIEYLCYGSGDTMRREELRADHRELLARVLGQPVDAAAAEAWADGSLAEEPAGAPAPEEMTGRHIGGFELLSRLGQGGMGVVYRAWQPSLGRQVALKCTLRAGDPKAEARFAREIRALGRVEHANVVKVFTSGAEGDQWFYAMELIEGAELSRVCEQLAGSSAAEIDAGQWRHALTTACEQARSQETQLSASGGELNRPAAAPAAPAAAAPARSVVPLGGQGHVAQVVSILRQIAEAAHTLHEAGVVHRDIKPGNIMLTTDGAHPVLMDLGLAQLADETDGRVTRTRQFVGTLRYASPEQVLAAGRVDRRTDVYSLGATLWELLTLRPIFGAGDDTPTPDLMLKIQTTDPESPRKYNRHVPRDLEAIVLKCLEKDRGRRYATAADLAADLGRFLGGEPVSAQPPSMTYLTAKFVRRYRVPLAVAGVVVAVLLGGTVAAFLGIDRQRRAALDANDQLQEQLYDNYIAVAERELTLNQDVGLASDLLERCPEHLRGWEWDYLMRLRDGDRLPLGSSPALGVRPAVKGMPGGHNAGVWMAAFSPDGRRVATCSIDGTVKIWDTASGRVVRTYTGHDRPSLSFLPSISLLEIPHIPVMCLAFSPDGRYIASGSFSPKLGKLQESPGVVIIWEAETGHAVKRFDKQIGPVLALAFSPDGRRVASSSINDDNSFVVWDAQTGAVVHFMRGHTNHVHRLCYSPDGRLLASGSADGSVKLWDAATFQEIRSIDAHPALVSGLAFAPDGGRFVSAGQDGTVRVWDTATGAAVLAPLRGHTGAALGVAFSPDGKRIASAGYDKTVRLWDAASGKLKITLRGHTDMVWSVAFSQDGRQLVSASFDSTARIWDATPRQERGGPGLFTVTGHTDRVNTVAFSSDRRYLASGSWDHTVRLWDAQTGDEIRTLEGHKGAVWSVAFSPDSTRLVSASWDKTVKVWDTATGRELLTFSGHNAMVHCVAFSPDGKRVASGSLDAFVKIWDPATGTVLATYAGGLFPFSAVAFSPDGKRLALGSTDRTIIVWDADTGKDLFTLKGHEGAIPSVAFSPDGKRLVSASWDYTLKVWDVDPARQVPLLRTRELLTLKGHSDQVNGVAFSPDGTRIASAGDDKTVRIWDAATGREVVSPCLHRGVVWSVAFSPDGERVVAGCWSASGWVKTWNAVGKARTE